MLGESVVFVPRLDVLLRSIEPIFGTGKTVDVRLVVDGRAKAGPSVGKVLMTGFTVNLFGMTFGKKIAGGLGDRKRVGVVVIKGFKVILFGMMDSGALSISVGLIMGRGATGALLVIRKCFSTSEVGSIIQFKMQIEIKYALKKNRI